MIRFRHAPGTRSNIRRPWTSPSAKSTSGCGKRPPGSRGGSSPRAAEVDRAGVYPEDYFVAFRDAGLLSYRAAWLVDQGHGDRDAAHYLSMAKAMASEVAVRAADQALQTLGGFGYLKDYPVERHYRDAEQLTIVEGTSGIHRLIIVRALKDGLLDWGYDVAAAGPLPRGERDVTRRRETALT